MEKERYNRQQILPHFGNDGQQKLLQAKVLVIGAGGLGVPVLQYLTGMGVGTIGVMDGDVVSLSNLHRQVLYAETDIGLNKAIVAAQKLKALNSTLQFNTIDQHLTPQNALDTIKLYDLIIDATDNFSTRYLINDACVILKKPFVYGAVHQYEGQVSVFNFDGGPTYRCLYPNMPGAHEIPDCNTGGVLGVVPGIIGCYMALEAIKLITGIGKTIAGNLLIFDLLNGSQYSIQLKTNPANLHITELQKSYDTTICTTIPDLPVTELLQWLEEDRKFTLLDLRDEEDFEAAHLSKAQFFTTQILAKKADALNKNEPVATICYRGLRSRQAAGFLKEKYPQLQVYNVTAGMDEWTKIIGDKFLIHD